MKQLISLLFLSTILGISAPAIAGAGHDHDANGGHSHGPITSASATEKAKQKLTQLVKAGKIDASWTKTKAAKVEQKMFSKGPEWVVTFKNDKITDAAKQSLYFFYSLDGHYIAANYSGN